jgi:hypothetical protein
MSWISLGLACVAADLSRDSSQRERFAATPCVFGCSR